MKNLAPRLAVLGASVRNSAKSPAAAQRHAKNFARRKDSHSVSLAAGIFFTCLLAAFLFLTVASASQAQMPPLNESERELFELLNRERASHNQTELKWDEALFKAARKHALLMLDLNILEHQLPGEPGLEERIAAAGARFTYIAENIAIGKDSATIHDGWMHSPGHRANILSPRITSVGIAVVRGTTGLFAVQDFAQTFANESLEQQEKQVSALLAAKGLRVVRAAEEARKACDGLAGMPSGRSGALIRFETGSLSEIPPDLEKKIRGQPFRNVSVGACRTSEAAGFARYKIALLFF